MSLKSSFFFCTFSIFGAITSNAQETFVNGSVADSAGNVVPFTKVSLYRLPDSTLVNGIICDEFGHFKIELKEIGSYQLSVSFTGYQKKDTIFQFTGESVHLGKIIITQDARILDLVDVKVDAISASQDGDTTNYNAGAYKVNPDANAQDLVNKIPGVGVVDGKVQAQGEQVTEVLVDGKPFFGSDPNSVLKNIPAEMIDQVQIYDKKSDQSTASGIDDGTTTKTINIITKVDYKNGTFGRVYGGYGSEDRFQGGFSLNNFKDNQRISFIGLANNINQQNFSGDDLSGIFNSGSGGGGNEFAGYMNTSNFQVSQKDGLSTTYASGLNYVNKWKKTDFTGSYFFNLTSNETFKDLDRLYITDDVFDNTYTQSEVAASDTYMHRLNFKLDVKLDSSNSINIKPNAVFQQHDGSSNLTGKNYSGVFLTNDLTTLFSTEFNSAFVSVPVSFTHRFAKKKRSLSIFAEGQYDVNNGFNTLFSQTYMDIALADSIDQVANLAQNGYLLNGELSYSEPLGKNAQLIFSLEQDYSKSFAEKKTRSLDNTGEYVVSDSSLSNVYSLNYMATRPTLSYKYQWTKSSLSINVAVQSSQLSGDQEFPVASEIDKHFFAVLPSVQFSYRPAKKKNLRVNYSTKTQNPEISELQSVVDNTNPIQLRSGNPNLVQEYYQTLSFRYSSTNAEKNTNFNFNISASQAQNYIATNSIFATSDTMVNGVELSPGMQYKYPVNMNGYLTARSFIAYGRYIKKIKSNGTINLGVNYSNRPSMINNERNKTGSTSLRLTLGLSSNISEKVDFNLNSVGSYTVQNSTLNATNTYYNQRSQLKLVYNFWKGFVFEADATHQYYIGLSSEVTNNFITANASFGYKFFKKKGGHLRLTVFDIFNQNSAVSRTITDIYFEDAQSNTINRYFMVEFIYKFNYFRGG